MQPIPVPQIAAQWAWMLAVGALIGGAVLLLWGGRIHRFALALGGLVGGFFLGEFVAPHCGVAVLPGQIIGALVLGVFGFLAARLVWAWLAAALGLTVTTLSLIGRYAPAERPAAEATVEAAQAWLQWLKATWGAARSALSTGWEQEIMVLLPVLIFAVAIPMLVFLIRPVLGRILMTSLVGAAAVVFAAVLGAAQVNRGYWDRAVAAPLLLAAAVAVLMVGGLAFQYVRVASAEREKAEREKQEDREESEKAAGAKRRKNKSKDADTRERS